MDWIYITFLVSVALVVGLLIVLLAAVIRAWRRREKFPVAELAARLAAEAGPPTDLPGSLATPPATPTPEPPVNFRAGLYLLGAMVVSGGLLAYINPPVGVAVLGIILIYLGTNLHEVRDPNAAFLFRMGKMVGRLSAGWYLTIPHLWTIQPISLERVTFSDQELPPQGMYTKAKRPITLKVRVFYQVKDLDKALRTQKIIHSRVKAVVLAQLKGEVGKREFTDLLTDRGALEDDIQSKVTTELESDGYEVTGVEVEDLFENVESQAETIRTIGRARGDAARALAEPLKDNYPAAIVNALGTLAEAGERVIAGIRRRQAPPAQPASPEQDEGAGVTQQLAETVRQITRR